MLLASARGCAHVRSLVEVIIERYCGADRLDQQFLAGKYIVELRRAYLAGTETIDTIDNKLSALYPKLGYPNWLVMLSRNCEYATDVPAFEQPFEQEFHYISALWSAADSLSEFKRCYSPEISARHDVQSN